MHDTKIGIIVRIDLEVWQKLNVTAFLASGIAFNASESKGEQYVDGSENLYLPIFNQPVFVYGATSEQLQRTRTRALSREVPIALYTKEMFSTGDDVANRAVSKREIGSADVQTGESLQAAVGVVPVDGRIGRVQTHVNAGRHGV